MVFFVTILAQDDTTVFDWVRQNVDREWFVRMRARDVPVQMLKPGFADEFRKSPKRFDPSIRGCIVEVFVNDRKTADYVRSEWKDRSDYCKSGSIGK